MGAIDQKTFNDYINYFSVINKDNKSDTLWTEYNNGYWIPL